MDDKNFLFYLKSSNTELSKNIDTKLIEYIEDKITIQNVFNIYQLTGLFRLQCLYKYTYNYLERCFTMLAQTPNFLNLEYSTVAKLLKSSSLHITSELEVYNAANEWLTYKFNERSKFVKDILLKVRFHSLSDFSLESLLKNKSSLTCIDDCFRLIKQALESKKQFIQTTSKVTYTNRFCNQDKFNILFCGGNNIKSRTTVKNVYKVDGSCLKTVKVLPSMIKERRFAEAVCVKGNVYIFSGRDSSYESIMSVEKYSPATKAWSTVTDMHDKRIYFCTCGFMNHIFVIGGKNITRTRSCLQFDAEYYNWKEVSGMNEARSSAACVVFEEKIIVAGGFNITDNKLRTVESYDAKADEWSPMPNMITVKSNHKLISVKSKLYVIGWGKDNCEVFDKTCKKFVSLTPLPKNYLHFTSVVSIGSKIFVFKDNAPFTVCYDVDADEWIEQACDVTKYLQHFTCVKVPWC